jgi:hypothetical protein
VTRYSAVGGALAVRLDAIHCDDRGNRSRYRCIQARVRAMMTMTMKKIDIAAIEAARHG